MTHRHSISHRQRLLVAAQVVAALAIFTLNHSLSLVRNHGDYVPFSVGHRVSGLVYDETHAYAATARRFVRTGHLPSKLDVADSADRVRSLPVLNGVFIGSVAYLSGNLEATWMCLHGALPALIWLLIYRMLATFTAGQLLPSVGAWVSTLVPFAPRSAVLLGPSSLIQPLEITRMPGPAVTFLLLLLAVVVVARALADGGVFRLSAAGVVCGLLFYSYYFSWISMFVGLGTLLLVSAVARSGWTGRLFLILLIGSVVGLPQVGMTLWSISHGAPSDMMARVGYFERTVRPMGLLVFVAAAILLVTLVTVSRRSAVRRPSDRALALILVLTSVAIGAGFGCNLHVFSGYQAQHGHFLTRVIHPVVFIIGFIAIAFVLGRCTPSVRRAGHVAMLVGALTCVTLGIFRQVQVAVRTGDDHRASAPRVDVARWLRAHVAADSVVAAFDGQLIALVPAFTGTWTFAPLGNRTTVSDGEILVRYLLAAYLEGRDLKRVGDDLLVEHPATNRLWPQPVWRHWSRRRLGPELSDALPQTIANLDAKAALSKRRLDYFLLPSDRSGDRIADLYPQAKVIYTNDAWSVIDVGR